MASASNKTLPLAVRTSGYPFDRPEQIRPGVRNAEVDQPWSGKYSVPSPGDKGARHGEIESYDKMAGKVTARTFAKGLRGGSK